MTIPTTVCGPCHCSNTSGLIQGGREVTLTPVPPAGPLLISVSLLMGVLTFAAFARRVCLGRPHGLGYPVSCLMPPPHWGIPLCNGQCHHICSSLPFLSCRVRDSLLLLQGSNQCLCNHEGDIICCGHSPLWAVPQPLMSQSLLLLLLSWTHLPPHHEGAPSGSSL